jgi:hypothetical protein
VDRHDRLRLGAQSRRDAGRVDVPRRGIDVYQHRLRAGGGDRLDSGDERHRCRHDLAARPYAHRLQRELQRVGPVAHPDAVRSAAVRGELSLEGFQLGTEDERAARRDAVEHAAGMGGDRLVLASEIDEWDSAHWRGRRRMGIPPTLWRRSGLRRSSSTSDDSQTGAEL